MPTDDIMQKLNASASPATAASGTLAQDRRPRPSGQTTSRGSPPSKPPVPTASGWAHDPYQHYQLLRKRTKVADNVDEIQQAVSILSGVVSLL